MIDTSSDAFGELCAIIVKFNAQDNYRVRLLHRHRTIPEGHILLGTGISDPPGYWTRPIRISDIDLNEIHGHIYSIDAASLTKEHNSNMRNAFLFASEFREGAPVDMGIIDRKFFTEFTDCLLERGLENTIGLEAVQGYAGKMIELSFDHGSLLLNEEIVKAEAKRQLESRETGWAVKVINGVTEKDGETRCIVYPTGHVRATKVPVLTALDALKVLREEGVLA